MNIILNNIVLPLNDIISIAKLKNYDQSNSWENSFFRFILDWFDPQNYIITQSSGSTGTPKEIKLNKKDMKLSANRTIQTFNIQPEFPILLCMDCNFIGAKMMVVRALENNNDLVVVSPEAFPDINILNQHFEFAAMVPIQLNNLLETHPSFLQNFSKIIIGGSEISINLQQKIKKYTSQKTKTFETYGMTETISHIAYKEYDEEYFTPLNHIEISLSPNNCMMLHDNLTSEKFIITNDMVDIKEDENHHKIFKLLGRYDFIINSGGIKINPEQIENNLSPYIPSRVFCIGVPDSKLGEKLVLLIEGAPNEFNQQLLSNLPKYHQPKSVFFIPEFVYLKSGKIDRKNTKALFLQNHSV